MIFENRNTIETSIKPFEDSSIVEQETVKCIVYSDEVKIIVSNDGISEIYTDKADLLITLQTAISIANHENFLVRVGEISIRRTYIGFYKFKTNRVFWRNLL